MILPLSGVQAKLTQGPWLYVGTAAVLLLLVTAMVHQREGLFRLFRFFKPWTVPLLGGGWCSLACAIGLMFLPGWLGASNRSETASSGLETALLLSGFALCGLAFMGNADRFSDSMLKDLC